MNAGLKFTGLLVAGILCLPGAGRADTQSAPHRAHKVKKQQRFAASTALGTARAHSTDSVGCHRACGAPSELPGWAVDHRRAQLHAG